jgi:transglutaminase-like putative cysteine protease
VESNGIISNAPAEIPSLPAVDHGGDRGGDGSTPPTPSSVRQVSHIDPAIEQYARRPEVSGTDAQGPLAARRRNGSDVDSLDPQIAENIAAYLRTNFTYTLDLRDAQDVRDRDPMVAFLYDLKRGHCEYFAGSMALMCQSLGMQARVVVGFRCDEFNPLMNAYVVSQNQAHAWVEVLDPTGNWRTYDPTSGRGADQVHNNSGMWRSTMHLMQYLEYTWANRVVAYDRQSRANLITNVDRTLSNSATDSSETAGKFRKWVLAHVDTFASNATSVLFVIMILVLIGAIGWFLVERWRLRRRARRIGLDTLPASDKSRLLRQLGFYDELLLLLDRHRIARPSHLTPMEFSRSVTFLPNEVFDSIRRLTDIFYRVRYGRHELTPAQQRHLYAVIREINQTLAMDRSTVG